MKTLVDAFVAAAQEDDTRAGGEALHGPLGQRPAARGEEDRRAIVGHAGERIRKNIRAHHHAGAAAERGVIDGAMTVGGGGADVHGVQRPQAALQRAAGQRLAERPWEHLFEQRQHGGAPGHAATSSTMISSGGTTVRRPAARSTSGTAAWVKGTSKAPISRLAPAP